MRRLMCLMLLLCARYAVAGLQTQNVVLVTLDGVRIQEIFTGMDPLIAAHAAQDEESDIELARTRYWRDTAEARREALLPFFWTELAPMGIVLGNPERGSRVQVRNAIKWSSPGYSEIMTGQVFPEVIDNTIRRYPHRTFAEYIVTALGLPPTAVAEFGSWDGFKMAASSTEDAFFTNGAYEAVAPRLSTRAMDELVSLRARTMGLWEESSNDVVTYQIATRYLTRHKPRFMWLAFGQTDDWAHADRYDRLLECLHLTDRLLDDLWQTLQSDPHYRGHTTLVITTDHGRGRTATDWVDHDATIPGSGDIWLAVIGPDTPDRGEVGPAPTVSQTDIAATVLTLFGLDPADFSAAAGPPVRLAFEQAR